MSNKIDELEYRVRQHDRQITGMQRQMKVMAAQQRMTEKKTDRRLRDLEIRAAVHSGLAQNEVAKIFELSPGRITQIMKVG